MARESHHEGTAAWFIRGNMFLEWKASGQSSLIWVHGKRELSHGSYILQQRFDSFSPL